MEAVTLDLATRSLSFSVILTKPFIVPISLHLPSRSNISTLLRMHRCVVLPYWVLLFIFRYSSINEINKITQQNTGSKVFVYFVTRLPRMEGGTSYVGFHGGKVTTTCELLELFIFCYHIVWRIENNLRHVYIYRPLESGSHWWPQTVKRHCLRHQSLAKHDNQSNVWNKDESAWR